MTDTITSTSKRGRRRGAAAQASTGVAGGEGLVLPAPAGPYDHLAATHGQCALLSAATVLLMSLIFAPLGFWPVAFVCLAPWLVLVSATPRAPRAYAYSFVLGLVFFLINMRWLYAATGFGYVMLSIYQAVYFPLAACVVRSAVRRRHWPLALVAPLVWTGTEMVRAVAFSGFPWFYLGHSFYRIPLLIQISDVVGAYGVSFVAVAMNGALADGVLARYAWRTPDGPSAPRRGWGGLVFAGGALLITAIYGVVQLSRSTTSDGPMVAVLQGDYLNSVSGDADSDDTKREEYFLKIEAAAATQPDMIVLPETPWIMYLNPEARDFFHKYRKDFQTLREFATSLGVYLVTGSASLEPSPGDLVAKERQYNSAMVFPPSGGEPMRYDKVHVVPFGETVPFRGGRFHIVYKWMNSLMPFSGPDGTQEFSLWPGRSFRSFTMQPRGGGDRTFRFGIPICYEDVMPYVSREFTGRGSDTKKVDFLLNISNDGWFGHGTQQAQHLAICVFRAVENRVGVARAVNTGISGFITPNGGLHDLVVGDKATSGPGKGGWSVGRVKVDSRFSLYTRYGDWFGWMCALGWLALFVDYWMLRAREA